MLRAATAAFKILLQASCASDEIGMQFSFEVSVQQVRISITYFDKQEGHSVEHDKKEKKDLPNKE